MLEKLLHERASYLRDAVFSASDGLVTTFAVVAGSRGASLDSSIVIILGFANLFADGFSMASGTYLGVKSETEFESAEGDKHTPDASPFKQGLVTFFSFNVAGLLPLMSYLVKTPHSFNISVCVVIVTLFCMGVVRSRFTRKNWYQSGFEMLIVGGFAAFVAYATGYLIDRFLI